MTTTITTSTFSRHEWDYCHDDEHDAITDTCPACRGYMMACYDCTPDHIKAKRYAEKIRARRAQTTSGSHPAASPGGPEAGTPGGEVEQHSPAAPSRPGAHQRVTNTTPFLVEQDVHDEDWTVTVHLDDHARLQLARDLADRHIADLVLLARLRQMERAARRAGVVPAALADDLRQAEARVAGALHAATTTQWVLTPAQAEDLQEQLEDAQADPVECAVGTCSAYAVAGGSYCAPHEDVI